MSIDGPRVWFEFIAQEGVAYRDKLRITTENLLIDLKMACSPLGPGHFLLFIRFIDFQQFPFYSRFLHDL